MWHKSINGQGDDEVARFAMRQSSLSVYSISYPHSVQRSSVSGGGALNHLKISMCDLLVSSHQGVVVYGEFDMQQFHPCPAVRASDRICSCQRLAHFLPGEACGFPGSLLEQRVDCRQEFSGGSVGEESVIPDVPEVLVGYMGYEPFKEVLGGHGHHCYFVGIMVKVFEGYGIAVKSCYPGFSDRGTFKVFAEIVDGLFPVRGLFIKIHDPVFSPEGVEESVELLFAGEVCNGFGEAQSSGVEFFAEECYDGIPPEGFQDTVMEVGPINPFLPVSGKSACSCGQVDVVVSFEISPESVDGEEYAGKEILLSCLIEDDLGCPWCEQAHQIAVCPDEWLEFARKCEGDVLPDCSGKSGVSIGNPLIRSLFPAGRAEPGLAGVRGIDEYHAFWTEKPVEAECLCPTDKQLDYIGDDGGTHEMAFPQEELPPVTIPEENIPYFNCAA